ncbi:sorting nexin-19a [Colossoma macropomum]|uniref:sorting nexin-19a n=1 Tax=Colossoma macropomum TaxID=42526 RepID=UPI001864FFF2|nr:sorting nexin-19a [Colossoma macropomum]
MPGFEGTGPSSRALPMLMGQRSIVGFVVLITWLVLFYLLVNVWLLCIFTSLLVVLGGWLGSRAALDANSLLHLEHFLPLGQAPLPHASLESERRLDWEIHCAVEKAVRDFVSSWYRTLVSEEEGEFQQEIRDAMLAAAAELKRRARQVDRRVLAQRMLELCGCHLQSFSEGKGLQKVVPATSVKPQQQGPRKQEGREGSRSTLWKLYSEVGVPHPALASSAAELCYSRAVVDLLLHVLVPYPHLETRTGRYLVGELITCNVLLPLVAQISNPDWLNKTIVDVFTKSAGQDAEGIIEEPPSHWDRDFHTPLPWDHSETSSMQTARSNSTLPLQESSESSLQTLWSSEDCTKGGLTSESPYLERAAPSPTELLSSPCRSSRLYYNIDYDIESPLSDSKKISNESLDLNDSEANKDETFCDCINPADFCGLVCLDDDTLAVLGKRIRPKVLISEPLSRPESPMEDPSAGSLPQATNSSPCGTYLSSFGLESLGSLEGPVVIKNLRITGTITAKEQKGNSSHPYTLYTVKYETVVDTDSLSTDQAIGYHTVNRRYSEFLNLQTRLEERSDLKKVIKNIKGPKKLFPDLSFGNPDAEKVEARKGQLESFLKKLCSIPEAARSEEVQEFLALNTDASAAFEKKPCGSRIDKMVENIVDTLKTAFPRSEPQSPTDDGEPDADGSRLRFSSIIASTTLSVPDFQPKITYCFSEGSTVFKGPLGIEGFVLEQEKRIDGEPRKSNTRGEEQEEKDGDRAAEKKTRGTDTALADVALNILCLLMKDQWSWLCTENIQKTIRLLFGTIIERWLEVGIAHLTSAPCWVIYLRVLQEAVWPGGDLPVGPQPERSPEQREETRLQCLDCLMKLFPELIPDILGCEKYKLSWEHVLESLQDPHINRHLVYCIFDLLLEFLVPESSEEAFQKSLLHSLSCDVETSVSA